jgi:hypothetical protein
MSPSQVNAVRVVVERRRGGAVAQALSSASRGGGGGGGPYGHWHRELERHGDT